jgi:hypothetical protein
MNSLRLPILASLLLGSSAANASLVTIDANSFATGTDVSNVTEGVTLSSMWTPDAPVSDPPDPIAWNFSPVTIVACADGTYDCSTIAGPNVFGHENHVGWNSTVFANEGRAKNYLAGDPVLSIQHTEVFRADFTNATNFVQLIVGGAHNNDYPRVDFWDTSGALIESCSTPDGGGYNPACNVVNLGDLGGVDVGFRQPWLISLTTPNYDIGFITSGGWAGGQFVTQLTFNEVPEPGTLALMLVGAIGVALRRKRESAAA